MILDKTTEDWLNLTIHNRPAPEFTLVVNGNGNTTDTECLVTMQQSDDVVDFSSFQKIWRIQGAQIEGDIGDTYDCSVLPAYTFGFSEVINNELISAIEGVNLVRLPGVELTAEEKVGCAIERSYGEDTETESVGWISIGVLGLVVVVLSYLILR